MGTKKDEAQGAPALDLSEFVTQDNAEAGVWFPFDIDGKQTGAEICVLGADSDPVALYAKQAEKKAKKMLKEIFSQGKADFDEEKARTELDEELESAVVRIAGIRRTGGGEVVVNGVEIGQDKKSYRYFCQKIRHAVGWVIAKSTNRANFFAGRKKS